MATRVIANSPPLRERERERSVAMAKGHVLVLPMPCQGHVTPLMELSHRLVDHGFEVTFVNTEVDHALVVAALQASSGGEAALGDGIRLASIPDGLADDEDRKDLNKLIDAYSRHMPGYLERLIADMEAAGRPRVKWLVGDVNMGWSFEVAKKLGIRVASFWPASLACLAIMLKIPKLIEDGLLNDNGLPQRHETFQLAPGMAPLHTSQLSWNNAGAPEGQHIIFDLITRNNRLNDLAEMVVCNSFHEAEAGAFKLFPNVLPIGPLFADREFQKPVGHFLPEDERCIKWLDARPDRSVVYVAFGSMAIFDPYQFEELAEGLELTGRPFLWVVRPDFTPGLSKVWLAEFQQRVAGRGMIVSWCSQQQVLAHRAVACFVSHCGWNSTMEGVRNGMPFLCWPYFCDQYLDRSYITNVWRTGLAVSPGSDGIVTKEELRSKVEQVIGDVKIKERARVFMDASRRCISEGGSSYENFTKFVNLLSE
ncbi:UDP-glycosyltransferase 83A1-like [Phragmites australis]|uniref:UDP-glycosyltransferase 83A1-like n=1 Tax=Phragmites australis TaxID=29695 RepID=UPI002D789D23|nr:UDP-glycosyltransferase 83A1-like [Phragmites australis]